MREYHARSTINIILCAGERAQLLFLTDIRAGKQMRERGPRGKAIGGKGVLAGKQMLGSLGFDIFSSPGHVNQNFKCLKMVLEYAYQIGIELLILKLSSVFLYL